MRNALRALLVVTLAASCAPDARAPVQQVDPSKLFWTLTLDHHAVTLSLVPPYDTLLLTATPRTSSGAALSDAPAPHFKSTDIEHVWVDSTGLLHARKVATNIVVMVTDTVDDIVHADTVWVNVNDVAQPPVLATLSIHPVPPDSAKFALRNAFVRPPFPPPLAARALEADSNVISGLVVLYTSLNPAVAAIDPLTGEITPNQVGAVTFIANATAYGISKADTLSYTIGLPLLIQVNSQPHVDGHGDTVLVFSSPVLVGVGADVLWYNPTGLPLDVTFDDSTNVAQDDLICGLVAGSPYEEVACGNGNISSWKADPGGDGTLSNRIRQFRVPGTYHYHSTLYGTTGTIIVQ